MEPWRAGSVEPGELPGRRGRGERAGFARPDLRDGSGILSAPRRVLADRRGRQEAVRVLGRPLLMLVPMDQDLGELAGAAGFVAVVVNVRSRPGEPRPHRGGEEQAGGGESLPYTHGAHCGPAGTRGQTSNRRTAAEPRPRPPGWVGEAHPGALDDHLPGWRRTGAPVPMLFTMMRAGRMTPIVAGLLALVLGVPGLLHAGCPACAATVARTAPDCHEKSGPELHPACCGGSPAAVACCGEMTVPKTTPGIEAVAAKAAPSPAPLTLAPVAVASVREALARPARLAGGPLLYEGAGLYTLHSVLLI